MAKFTLDDIKKLYVSEAEKHGTAGTSTIQDIRTRHLEMEAIFSYLRDGQRVLEIGCGNGYVSAELVKTFDVELDAFDFSNIMIELARRQDLSGARGRVRFAEGDVLRLEADAVYDIAFSERCIQNLIDWDDQKVALKNIARSLKVGGQYLMDESFWSGLKNLNEARAELDLDPIPESW